MADKSVQIRLTAKRIGPAKADLSRPKVYNVNSLFIGDLAKAGTGSVFKETGNRRTGTHKVEVYETPSQVRLNENVSKGITDGIYDLDKNLGVAGAGTDLAGATQLAAYFNKVSAVTATTADGIKLLATPTVGQTCIVVNAASAAVDVFPNTATSKIDNQAVSAVKSVAVGQAIHFVCSVAGASATWKSAIDENNS